MTESLPAEQGSSNKLFYSLGGAVALFLALTIIFIGCFASSSSTASSCQNQVVSEKIRNEELTRQVQSLQAQLTNLTNQNTDLITQLAYALGNVTLLTNLTLSLNSTVQSQNTQINSLSSANMWLIIGTSAGSALGIGSSVTAILEYFQLQAVGSLATSISNQSTILTNLTNSSQGLGNAINTQIGTIQNLSTAVQAQSPLIQAQTIAVQQQTAAVQQQSLSIWSVNTSAAINTTSYINNTFWMIVDDALNNNDSPSLPYTQIYDSGIGTLNRTTLMSKLNNQTGVILIMFTDKGYAFGAGLYSTWNSSLTNITDYSAFTFSVNNGGVCGINDPKKALFLSNSTLFDFGRGEIVVYENGTAMAIANYSFTPMWGYPVGVTNLTFYAGSPQFIVNRIIAVNFTAFGANRRRRNPSIDIKKIIEDTNSGLRSRNYQ